MERGDRDEECKEKLLSEDEREPPADFATDGEKRGVVIYVGQHKQDLAAGQASSISSEEEEEAEEDDVSGGPGPAPGKGGTKLSGGCMLKLTAVAYLAACILVSALYVAIYGQHQPYSSEEEVWIPGKVSAWAVQCRAVAGIYIWQLSGPRRR